MGQARQQLAAPPMTGRGEGGPRSVRQFPRQPAVDQRHRFLDPVDRDETAEARPLAGPQQHLVDRLEPVAQRLEAVRVADREDDGLQGLGVAAAVMRRQPVTLIQSSYTALRLSIKVIN